MAELPGSLSRSALPSQRSGELGYLLVPRQFSFKTALFPKGPISTRLVSCC